MYRWCQPEGRAPYRRDGVHVWLARMPDGWSGGPENLSDEERLRAARFVDERHRRAYVFHHTALRAILAGYTELAPERIRLSRRDGEKPVIEGAPGGWTFNLSHCGAVGLCAVAAGREVGVDIERVRPMPNAMNVARRFFAPAEVAVMERLEGEARDQAFLACWTRKEAFVKATGRGLRRDLRSFTVPVDARGEGPWEIEPGWTVAGLPRVEGYVCALAVEGRLPAVHTWRATFG
jgi:4'-phosphopantetheinyl transferase